MVVCDGQAELGVGCKAAIRGKNTDGRGLEWVVGREHQLAMVDPPFKVGRFGSFKDEMPLKQVAWGWVSFDVWHRFLGRAAAPTAQ